VYISSSSTFDHIVAIGGNILRNISEFANPSSVQGLSIITNTATSPLYLVAKILYLLVNFLIAVGILAIFSRRLRLSFDKQYFVFSVYYFILLIGGITVPNFAAALNTERLYQIALIFLAPFSMIGGKFLWDILVKKVGSSLSKIDFYKITAIFLAIFLLLSSGWVYEIAHDRPSSISLSNAAAISLTSYSEEEVTACTWLNAHVNNVRVTSDAYLAIMIQGVIGLDNVYYFKGSSETGLLTAEPGSYFVLGYRNIVNGTIIIASTTGTEPMSIQNSSLYNSLMDGSTIYHSGEATINLR
jgi:uncharacterized membrane protein